MEQFFLFAYVGPGSGMTFLTALWAFLSTLVLLILGALIWPIRMLYRMFTGAEEEEQEEEDSQDEESREVSNETTS